MDIVVNISDAKISSNPDDRLLTYALGSCIGVAIYDDLLKVGGLLHFQLPSATDNPDRAKENPAMFADSGMAHVLDLMSEQGIEMHRLRIKIVGGAEMLNDGKLFNIGRRNHTAIRKILWQHGLLIAGEDIGGHQARTVRMTLADGSVMVKSNGEETSL